jgi:hypothetical protein
VLEIILFRSTVKNKTYRSSHDKNFFSFDSRAMFS